LQQGVVSQEPGKMTPALGSRIFSIMFPRQRMTKERGCLADRVGQGFWVRWASGSTQRCGGSIDVTNDGHRIICGSVRLKGDWSGLVADGVPPPSAVVLPSLSFDSHTAKLSCFPLTSFNRPYPKLPPPLNSHSVPTASARVFRIVLANLVAVAFLALPRRKR